MNYRQLIIDENEKMRQAESQQQHRDKDGWKWLNLNDKEGIRIFAECMRLDNIEEENEKFKQKNWRTDTRWCARHERFIMQSDAIRTVKH